MILDGNTLKELKRKRGEENLKISDLSRITSLSRFTLYRVFSNKPMAISDNTARVLLDWLRNKE